MGYGIELSGDEVSVTCVVWMKHVTTEVGLIVYEPAPTSVTRLKPHLATMNALQNTNG